MTSKDMAAMRPILYGLRASTEALLRHAHLRHQGPEGGTIQIPRRVYRSWVRSFEKLHYAENLGYWYARENLIGNQQRLGHGPNEAWSLFWSACHGLYDMGWSETMTVDEALARSPSVDGAYRRPEASRPALERVRDALRLVRRRPLKEVA